MNISQRKTRVVKATQGFDFLGWNFRVRPNRKLIIEPSKENYDEFCKKVKSVLRNSCMGAEQKAGKLAPIVRGWRNYHKYCEMSRFGLRMLRLNARKRFMRENIDDLNRLLDRAFPKVSWNFGRYVMVEGDSSPYEGNVIYWSLRKNKLYDNVLLKQLQKQSYTCGYCGLKFADDERIALHHKDGEHDNWKKNNLLAVHQSCHQYTHM